MFDYDGRPTDCIIMIHIKHLQGFQMFLLRRYKHFLLSEGRENTFWAIIFFLSPVMLFSFYRLFLSPVIDCFVILRFNRMIVYFLQPGK